MSLTSTFGQALRHYDFPTARQMECALKVVFARNRSMSPATGYDVPLPQVNMPLTPLTRRTLLQAAPIAQAIAQTGGFQMNGTYEGMPSVRLANDKMALTVLVQGSTIADLTLADDPEKLSPFWNPVRMARELGRIAQPGGSFGHFVCVDGFGPVSVEERAAGLPGHGEAHLQTFAVRTNKEARIAELSMTAKLPMMQESFSRTFRVVDGENVVHVESSLENLLAFDHPIQWAEHATVGSPFLESGVTVFDLSGSKSQTRPYQQTVNANNQTQRRLGSGRDFTWPGAPGVDGKTIDMRVTPESPHYLDHTTTLLDPSREHAWTAALNPKKRLLLGYVFRSKDYPWLQTWGNYPPTGKMARGMEFGTQPYDVPRREAVSMGTMFNQPTFQWLPAKSSVQTRFLFFYTRVPEGLTKIDDVRLENRQIAIEDHAAGKRVVLAASLPL